MGALVANLARFDPREARRDWNRYAAGGRAGFLIAKGRFDRLSEKFEMILTDLANCTRYANLGPLFEKVFKWLLTIDLGALADGKIELDGERLFALVQSYSTRPAESAVWEAHRRYADIQFIRSGEEVIGWQDIGRMEESIAYDGSRDVAFFRGIGVPLVLRAGQLTIFYPEDVHQPGVAVAEPAAVSKIVIKVMIGD